MDNKEFYLAKDCNEYTDPEYVEDSVKDLFIHVIEYSEYKKLQNRIKELEYELEKAYNGTF